MMCSCREIFNLGPRCVCARGYVLCVCFFVYVSGIMCFTEHVGGSRVY